VGDHLGARRGGLRLAVVVLPLFIPPVVFGAGALERAASGQSPAPALAEAPASVWETWRTATRTSQS
jgi:heme exporter protein B